jgi:hypothetical protein
MLFIDIVFDLEAHKLLKVNTIFFFAADIRIPYGQKTRNRLYSSVYDPARAVASACMLPTPSRILNADVGGTDVGRTDGGGQAYGLEDTAGIHHGDG